jgi:hypothetical protein
MTGLGVQLKVSMCLMTGIGSSVSEVMVVFQCVGIKKWSSSEDGGFHGEFFRMWS